MRWPDGLMAAGNQARGHYGVFHRVSSFRPCRQVTTIMACEVSSSALASRMAESTADFRFLRADTPVAAPLRKTLHSWPASFHSTRYSTSAILREPDLRPPPMRSCVVFPIATSTSHYWRGYHKRHWNRRPADQAGEIVAQMLTSVEAHPPARAGPVRSDAGSFRDLRQARECQR